MGMRCVRGGWCWWSLVIKSGDCMAGVARPYLASTRLPRILSCASHSQVHTTDEGRGRVRVRVCVCGGWKLESAGIITRDLYVDQTLIAPVSASFKACSRPWAANIRGFVSEGKTSTRMIYGKGAHHFSRRKSWKHYPRRVDEVNLRHRAGASACVHTGSRH